jgi:hypothetical protein
VAANLPVSEGAHLADRASIAFTDALGIGFAVAAAFAVVAAVLVKRRLPSEGRAPRTSTHVTEPLTASAAVEGSAG